MLIVMVWCRGGSTAAHMNITRAEIASVWTAAQLAEAKAKGGYKYIEKLEATWNEQRLYIDKALAVLGTSALATTIRQEFATLSAAAPTAASLRAQRYAPLPRGEWAGPLKMGRLSIAFELSSGALVRLDSADAHEGSGWASPSHPIGRLGYRSHSFEEWSTCARSHHTK